MCTTNAVDDARYLRLPPLQVLPPRRLLDVDLRLRLRGDAPDALVRGVELRQPVVLEPGDGLGPALFVGNDRLEAEVALRIHNVEPPVHRQYSDVERVQLDCCT